MNVQFQRVDKKDLRDDLLHKDLIILGGKEIGHINLWNASEGTFQAVLVISMPNENKYIREDIKGYGRTREEALMNALIERRKVMEILVKELACMETKIIGSQNHEQKEKPNTTGRIFH